MEINIEIRQKQLENFDQFIATSKRNLDDILATLGWTEEGIKSDTKKVACPHNKNHLIHLKGYKEHVDNCSLKIDCYDPKENFLSEPGDKNESQVYFNTADKIKILSEAHYRAPNFKAGWNGTDGDPKTADRLMSTFTPDERLALYEKAKSVTKGPNQVPEFTLTSAICEESNKEMSYAELLEQERNAKRRRIKYKSVHTSKKNHTEVMRDVIKNQMEAYTDWVKYQQNGAEDRSTRSRNSSHSDHSRDSKRRRSRDRSRRRSPHRHRSKHSRRRS